MSKQPKKAKAMGINHVVLEVGDIEAALEFYGRIFDFSLRGKPDPQAFIDMGDQFLQLSLNDVPAPDDKRHFGFVVDAREPIRAVLEEMGVEMLERGLNFRDPWGNRIEVVPYTEIQFSKAPNVLRGMELDDLKKTESAIEELENKGMG